MARGANRDAEVRKKALREAEGIIKFVDGLVKAIPKLAKLKILNTKVSSCIYN